MPMKAAFTWQRLVMLGAPLVLGILDLTQPALTTPQNIYYHLFRYVGYWLALALLRLVLIPLVALAVLLLTAGHSGRLVVAGRIAIVVGAAASFATTAITGVAAGIIMQFTNGQAFASQIAIAQAIDALWDSRLLALLALLSAAGWVVGLLAVVLTYARPLISNQLIGLIGLLTLAVAFSGQVEGTNTPPFWLGTLFVALLMLVAATPRLPMALLTAAALLLGVSQAPPHGSLGLFCLALGTALLTLPIAERLPLVLHPAPLPQPQETPARQPAARK